MVPYDRGENKEEYSDAQASAERKELAFADAFCLNDTCPGRKGGGMFCNFLR